MITMAQALGMNAELMRMDPPPSVARVGKSIITMATAGRTPPHDLIQYVQGWIAKRGQQNRYGK